VEEAGAVEAVPAAEPRLTIRTSLSLIISMILERLCLAAVLALAPVPVLAVRPSK